MTEITTQIGTAAAAPVLKTVNGNSVAEFRLGCDIRRRHKETGGYHTVHTNWFSVEAWGALATNIAASVQRGDVLMVVGALRIEQWESGERRGTSVRIRADHVGHSMRLGPSQRDRSGRPASADVSNGPPSIGGQAPEASRSEPRRDDEWAPVDTVQPAF